MRIQWTTDERLHGLSDFSYEPRYHDVPDRPTLEGFFQGDVGERFGQEFASFVREAA